MVYRTTYAWQFRLQLRLRAATLGANWVYWPSGSDFGQAQRRSPSQATHVSHLDLLHIHKIQGTTVYCPIRRT
jgi:hypothetical protein